ncbi:hypothetical protein KJ782_02155 [Patescibacteria group bacterium]|nr:hypothetical protein [Patescibacteria group bacterium]
MKKGNKPVLKDFSLKFIDVMLGIVLGLGFQWWPDLIEPWQYIAFIFVYINLVDYWIDYSPTIKKFPLKREVDVLLHTFIIFSMFYLVFTTQSESITTFLFAFIIYRVFDVTWIWRMSSEYNPNNYDKRFLSSWNLFDWIEIAFTATLAILVYFLSVNYLLIIMLFILLRITTRIMASLRYKAVYFS